MSWKKYEFGELAVLSSKKYYPLRSDENLPCIELEHIDQITGKLLGKTTSKEQKSTKNVFKRNQILYGKLRPYLRKYYKARFDGVCSTEIWVIEGKKSRIINDYLFFLIQTEQFNNFANVSSGSKMPRADWDYVSKAVFKIPPLLEQIKITEILFAQDELIRLKEILLEEKKKQKKYLMQILLDPESKHFRRLDGFYSKLKGVELDKCILEKNEKSITNNQYELMSSTKDGIFLQKEYFKKQIASKNNVGYKVLRKNNIVFSPQNLWMGNINFYEDEMVGIVSPSYKVFEVSDRVVADYFKYILKLPRMLHKYKLSSEQGASVVRRNLNMELFNQIKIKIPDIDEQIKISNILLEIDKEIKLIVKKLEYEKQKKKALMQLLLTGKVRTNNLS